ncbi:putative ORFan [Tupanvirus deep ocean]|uniref:ORFan n=2 Tax=Tupanvirus TaxID=2094720 RepID=A0AC62AA27_9VIRU|nr:putative ORFan [Tupanvirus deep ocean]QKU34637.1 putative ORFan [Tupanvirus deep ocean]
MALNIADIIRFKQQINETIDEYLNIVNTNASDNNHLEKVIKQMISYFDRMKSVYSSQQEDDDEDDEFISEDNDDDYTNIMEGRIYSNMNNIRDPELSLMENQLQRKLLGLNSDLGYREFSSLEDMGTIEDNSVDPTFYDSTNETNTADSDNNDDDDDEPGDCIVNNTRKTVKIFVSEPDIELVDENIVVDYNDPSIE